MPKPDDSSERALKRLDDKLASFQASRQAKPMSFGLGDSASDGFRMLGLLLGGVLGGLGLGWLFDGFAGSSPFGVLMGLVLGVTMSVTAVVRHAKAVSDRAAAENPPAPAAKDDSDDDDDG